MGIDTRGVTSVHAQGAKEYSATPYLLLKRIFESIKPQPTDVFLDVGCGKGRAICVASLRALHRVIGIDIDGDLLLAARRNLNRVPWRTPVELYQVRAENYIYSDVSILFLYNPFEFWVLREFVARLKETHRRALRVVYVNSVNDEVFDRASWLTKYEVWPPGALPGWPYPVTFYRSN